VANDLYLDPSHAYFRQTPQMKAAMIERFQREGRTVAFVGDGVNDSIALAQANVGISVSEGTTIAIEAADIVLLRGNLWLIVVVLDLARTTYRVIKFNFAWAFIYNAIALPLSAGFLYPITGFQLPPFIAGFAEIFSSLPVIGISLLLQKYKPPSISYQDEENNFEILELV
jgi:P-type Cu+ transporter